MNGSWSGLGQTRAAGVSWSMANNPTRQDAWQPKSRDEGEGEIGRWKELEAVPYLTEAGWGRT